MFGFFLREAACFPAWNVELHIFSPTRDNILLSGHKLEASSLRQGIGTIREGQKNEGQKGKRWSGLGFDTPLGERVPKAEDYLPITTFCVFTKQTWHIDGTGGCSQSA